MLPETENLPHLNLRCGPITYHDELSGSADSHHQKPGASQSHHLTPKYAVTDFNQLQSTCSS